MDGRGRTWTAGQVADRLGISPATLRTWHHRYGVGPGAPRPGQYRRYAEDDVARLIRMRDLIDAGALPSTAADLITSMTPAGRADTAVDRVARAVTALDTEDCTEALRGVITDLGVIPAWERVVLPALVAADDGLTGAPDCIAAEHLLSWAVIRALHSVPRPVGAAASVVLACAEDESHTLGLEALAAALAERGVAVRMLGPGVPAAAVAHAVRVSGAGVVVLWAQRPETARAVAVRAITRCGPRVLLAGPGWRRDLVGARRVGSLSAAVEAVRA